MKRQALDAEVKALWEAPLERAEFERRVAIALAEDEEIARLGELIDWFSRRYPTAKERLAYARHKYAEWTRTPIAIEPGEPNGSSEPNESVAPKAPRAPE